MCSAHFTLQLTWAKVRAARAPQTKQALWELRLEQTRRLLTRGSGRIVGAVAWINILFSHFLMITKCDSRAFVQAYRADADVSQLQSGLKKKKKTLWFACAHTLSSEWGPSITSLPLLSSPPSLPCEQTADTRRRSRRHTRIPAHTCATRRCFDWSKKGESFPRTPARLPLCKPSSLPPVVYWRSLFSPFAHQEKLIKRFQMWFRNVIRLPIELKMFRDDFFFFHLKQKLSSCETVPVCRKKMRWEQ